MEHRRHLKRRALFAPLKAVAREHFAKIVDKRISSFCDCRAGRLLHALRKNRFRIVVESPARHELGKDLHDHFEKLPVVGFMSRVARLVCQELQGIQIPSGFVIEFNEGAAEEPAKLLVRKPCVNDPDPAAREDGRSREFIHDDGFAGTRLSDDSGRIGAVSVGEGVDEEDLAFSAGEHEKRRPFAFSRSRACAPVFRHDGHAADGSGGRSPGEPAQLLHVGREPRSRGAGEYCHQRLGVQGRIGLQVHRGFASQRLRGLNGVGFAASGGEQQHLVEHPRNAARRFKASFADREFAVRLMVVGDECGNRRRHHLARAHAHGRHARLFSRNVGDLED